MGPIRHSGALLAALGAAPIGLAALLARPAWRRGLRERLGLREPAPAGCVWLHGASVGEVQAALRLAAPLQEEGRAVVLSAMTWAGRELLRARQPGMPSALAPIDHPWTVATAFRNVHPSLLVLVETEIWPSWIRAAHARGIPTVLVSARLSDRSFPRYQRFARWLRPSFARLAAVGARGEVDARRFRELGVPGERVRVTGDLKLAPAPPIPTPDAIARLAGSTPWFVAGSTHEGEEQDALRALAGARAAGRAAALVVAPRHPERFDAVFDELRASGARVRRRSEPGVAPLGDGDVLLLDSVGELAAVWSLADLAFVGGSLVDRGGHNVLEPAQVGRAPVFGPSTSNAREAAALLLDADGARRVADGGELTRVLVEALENPAAWRERGERARRALAAHAGSVKQTLDLLAEVEAASP